MILNRLLLKNFGRFSGKEIRLEEGINIIYGANESGKSTIHTFIQGIFFGMKRMRERLLRPMTLSITRPGRILDGTKAP